MLKDLYVREAKCGGYCTEVITFFPREFEQSEDKGDFGGHATRMGNDNIRKTTPKSPEHSSHSSISSGIDTGSSADIYSSSSSSASDDEEIISDDSEFDDQLSSDSSDSVFDETSNNKNTTTTSFSSSSSLYSSTTSYSSFLASRRRQHSLPSSVNMASQTQPQAFRRFSQAASPAHFKESRSTMTNGATYNSINSHANSSISLTEETSHKSNYCDSTASSYFTANGTSSTANNGSSSGATAQAHSNVRTDAHSSSIPVQVLVYTVTPDNSLYLGQDSVTNMAHQIAECRGTAGTNAEYVIKIAEFIRKFIPEDNDEYLFALDAKIRERLYRQIDSQRTSGSLSDVVVDYCAGRIPIDADVSI